jgi:hypothetical protein
MPDNPPSTARLSMLRARPAPPGWGKAGVDEVFDHPPRLFLGVDESLFRGFQGDELVR